MGNAWAVKNQVLTRNLVWAGFVPRDLGSTWDVGNLE